MHHFYYFTNHREGTYNPLFTNISIFFCGFWNTFNYCYPSILGLIPLDHLFGFIIPRFCTIFSFYLQILLALSCLTQVTILIAHATSSGMASKEQWLAWNSVALSFFLFQLFYKLFIEIRRNCRCGILELVCTVNYKTYWCVAMFFAWFHPFSVHCHLRIY